LVPLADFKVEISDIILRYLLLKALLTLLRTYRHHLNLISVLVTDLLIAEF